MTNKNPMIRMSKNMQDVLKKLKKFDKESYEDVVKRMVNKQKKEGLK
jgi:predicted CopG family antitoxin